MSSIHQRLKAAVLAIAVVGTIPDSGAAQPAVVSSLPPIPELYPSRDRAVLAAFADIASAAPYEWSGVIVERDGRYGFTLPVTSGRKYDVSIVTSIPKSFRIVALYHTHPCGAHTDRFSHTDVQLAVREKLPLYIRACRGRVYLFDPQEMTNDDRRRLRGMHGPFAGKELREGNP
jgi:hypothetical protein